ncbi:DUF2336 domain-containing protein [Pelagibius sp.]|uniref:DUF2336 domain-containing protein n=1 Tax=Pelagibius sp. TaxID=1931238 RepID=UPI003BAE537F
MKRSPGTKTTQTGAAAADKTAEELALANFGELNAETAALLGDVFSQGRLSEAEQRAALEVFKLTLREAEAEVRLALAEHVKDCPFLPQAIARELAEDIENVAVPVLKFSIVLTDEDLVQIIGSGNTAKQEAIAQRSTLTEPVSGALIDTGKRAVVDRVLSNSGAEISVGSFQTVIDAFAEEPGIQELLIDRPNLPTSAKERLVTLVSGDLRKRLIHKHDFPEALVEKLISQGRERALVTALSTAGSADEVEAAAMRLYLTGKLTPMLLLRTLCIGRLDVFVICIATLGRVSEAEARSALAKPDSREHRELFETARIPLHLQKAFQIALDEVLDLERGEATAWQFEHEERLVGRLVQVYDRLNPDSLESTLSQLGCLEAECGFPPPPARVMTVPNLA